MAAKRRKLTTDDLMRMQEEGPSGSRAQQAALWEDFDNSDDELEQVYRGLENIGRVHDESGSDGGSGTEDSEEDSADEEGSQSGNEDTRMPPKALVEAEEDEDGDESEVAGPSRVSFIPRKSFQQRHKSLISMPIKPSSFEALGISPALINALTKMSIKLPTEIQVACIPPLLQGRDCIGNAKTGSGKTIAFALPILQKLSVDPYGIFALVLTPTRELAFQISDQFAVLGASLNLRTAVVVGGMDMIAQAIELSNRPHIVVATPGRIVDHLKSSAGEWDLSRVKFLVLDEADRLLTSTFAPELAYLFDAIPKERQTCLFTATWTPDIKAIADAPPRPGKQKPFTHRITETIETVETLKQLYILVPSHVRESYLYYLLRNPPESTLHLRRAPPEKPSKNPKRPSKSHKPQKKKKNTSATQDDDEIIQPPPTIIFCTRPRTAAYLTAFLKTLHIRATALHSRLTQRERLTSLGLFRSSVVPVLVSTDVGARGLDIADVAMVVNWDMPSEPEEYTHRVGRTARAGRGGVAVSFVTERDEERVLKVEERIKTKLTEMELPESKVLESLNATATAKRLANMEVHDSDFGKREEIHRIKSEKRKRDVGDV